MLACSTRRLHIRPLIGMSLRNVNPTAATWVISVLSHSAHNNISQIWLIIKNTRRDFKDTISKGLSSKIDPSICIGKRTALLLPLLKRLKKIKPYNSRYRIFFKLLGEKKA